VSIVTIREECPAGFESIDRVIRLAFAGDEEAAVVHGLRDAGLVIASLVAARDTEVVGHVVFSRFSIETGSGTLPAVALGPSQSGRTRRGRV
jgi:putative acetyltransferase